MARTPLSLLDALNSPLTSHESFELTYSFISVMQNFRKELEMTRNVDLLPQHIQQHIGLRFSLIHDQDILACWNQIKHIVLEASDLPLLQPDIAYSQTAASQFLSQDKRTGLCEAYSS